MTSFKLKGTLRVFTLVVLLNVHQICAEDSEMCNKTPLNSKTAPLPPDDRFALEIKGVDDVYIPRQSYKIRLYAKDEQSSFIAFTISANADTKYNDKNPRKPILLQTGRITSSTDSDAHDTRTSEVCENTVLEVNVEPKRSIEALWIAPAEGNRCVTIYAFVAVKPDVWYSSNGPLSKQVCEDYRKKEDMKPPENNKCTVCEDARYELKFEGTWSFNTHSKMFPKIEELARFSDIVGASHNKNFILYRDDMEATDGLTMLAEQGNTTQLENQILEKLGANVRTLIKATGPPRPSMSTVTSFRTTSQHHFISVVVAILPSPDWFLGVYNLELCDAHNNNWAENVVLNLYPMDAGTDSGATFESPNEKTSPPATISRAKISDSGNVRPFAKLIVNLVRTYMKTNCTEETIVTDSSGGSVTSESTVPEPEPTSPPPPVVDPNADRNCPVTTWEEWLPCEGSCEDSRVNGYKTRFRYYVVDGVEVGKNLDDDEESGRQVPEECLNLVSTSEMEKCSEDCEEPTEEPDATSNIREQRLLPGQRWGGKK